MYKFCNFVYPGRAVVECMMRSTKKLNAIKQGRFKWFMVYAVFFLRMIFLCSVLVSRTGELVICCTFIRTEIPAWCWTSFKVWLSECMIVNFIEKWATIPILALSFFTTTDVREINVLATQAVKSGMIILGGGIIKHHICNANLMVRLTMEFDLLEFIFCVVTRILLKSILITTALHEKEERLSWPVNSVNLQNNKSKK